MFGTRRRIFQGCAATTCDLVFYPGGKGLPVGGRGIGRMEGAAALGRFKRIVDAVALRVHEERVVVGHRQIHHPRALRAGLDGKLPWAVCGRQRHVFGYHFLKHEQGPTRRPPDRVAR